VYEETNEFPLLVSVDICVHDRVPPKPDRLPAVWNRIENESDRAPQKQQERLTQRDAHRPRYFEYSVRDTGAGFSQGPKGVAQLERRKETNGDREGEG